MTQRIPLNDKFKIIRQNLHFILVEPESPGNVGSVARALKTMGFERLVLVNPCDLNNDEVKMMGHRSIEIVQNATIVSDFEQSIKDMRLTVATTMRKRHFKFPFFSPEQIAERLLAAAMQYPVAIVFGRESSGLTNEEILKCQLHSTIPTATQNPALNLAQAVMIYAYTFFQQIQKTEIQFKYELASQYELEKFYEHLAQAIDLVKFVPRDGVDNFVTRFRRLIGRSMAEHRDVRLLHKLLQIFETRIQDMEKEAGNQPKRNIY